MANTSAQSVRVRRDVWNLGPWDPILEWYAKAVDDMMKRPIGDPTSWRYQAAIHDYDDTADPLAQPSDSPPTPAQQQQFWRQCQHGTWFFLPWHRMYLWYFEQIVAATIVKLGGPSDWALPYWNYSDSGNPNAQVLPQAFRDQLTPSGSPNPLRIDQRDVAANGGTQVGTQRAVDLQPALTEPDFTVAAIGGGAGFGGPVTIFSHNGGTTGTLERVPHGSMHNAIGGVDASGADGWMTAFNTAPLDPIFWLHHSNIDRLWEVWLGRDPLHVNPTSNAWLTKVAFDFHDETGQPATLTPNQVLNTAAAPLFYRYEDVSDPVAAAQPVAAAAAASSAIAAAQPIAAAAAAEVIMAPKPVPEMVAATDAPLVLAHGITSRSLSVKAPTGPAFRAAAAPSRRRQVYLNLEGIKGSGGVGGYSVYLNLPAGADPREHEDRFAGVLPMFGLAEASRPDNEHGGSGLDYSLNVTDLVERLSAGPDWDAGNLQVSFVHDGSPEKAGDIRVGRVSLYYA